MKTVLNREDIPAIRAWVGEKARDALAQGAGKVEVVSSISRGVPIALVQEWFGFAGADPADMKDWSYWNQQDAFWNQPFDSVAVPDQAAIVSKREAANVKMAIWLAKLVAKKALAVKLWLPSQDIVSRLLRLSFSNATSFSIKDVILNLGGLLIGAVETTSHTVVNSVEFLLDRKDLLPDAHSAALLPDPSKFDGYIFEALRFRPAFPYYFRVCHRPTRLCVGTAHEAIIEPGTTVLAVTHSAMFDDSAFKDPMTFDPERNHADTFTFGQGLHECLGIAVARVMVPEIARQMLRQKNLQAASKPDYKGSAVPESWTLTYQPA
jgi:cytochrome P450